nr:ribosomal protein S13 [Cyanidiaceae sp.]
MVRIAGRELPINKRVEIALAYIYGIGMCRSKKILQELKIDINTRAKNLSIREIASIREYIERNYVVESDLRRFELINIKRLIEINSYKGKRHKMLLPVRGQRTKTNARTRRGVKRIINARKN